MRDKKELVGIDVELDDELQKLVINLFINEGRRREREEITAQLMRRYNESCCCDSANFGDHYLSHWQPDNIIDMINNRPLD